ncbi:MAG: hypothetical protein CVV21_00265 [Candidatus Goldiibacteriota bacterium HGW-Goldbacteria-1]|jgi:anti-sigma factor RsiW|nr:MAG: hypothetical protein CVV21_00265 [Candidatus Goldiibacteriota bacterium HGW-Goldbacteria-1]
MNKECNDKKELILDYIYGEIHDAAEVSKVKKHIETCADCAAVYASYKKIADAASEIKVDFPDSVWAMHRKGIHEKIEAQKNRKFAFITDLFRSSTFKRAGIATIMAVFVAGAAFQYVRTQDNLRSQAEIREKMEIIQNIEILERLDFYESLSRANGA